jgi:hypothetical protein
MCLFSKCCNYFKNKQIYTSNITHSREINTHIIPHNTNNNNIIHIINHDSEQESITESINESINESITESITESIQQNIIIFNNNTIIKSDDIRIPEPINDIHTDEQIIINTPINTHIQLVQHNDNHNDTHTDNEEQYTIIYNQHTNIQKDTTQDNLTTLDVYNISMNDDYEYSSDTEEYINVLESINIPYTQ